MSECISAVYVQNKLKVITQVSSSFTAGLKIHNLGSTWTGFNKVYLNSHLFIS